MKSFEVRKRFLQFFKNQQHKVWPSADLTPNDPSLLFVNAGMNQFKNVFLGLEPPPAVNVATIQKCLRAGGKHNDLEEVGETPLHHTFFEMLGNFSFGGYFKEEAIRLAWEFLTEELKILPDHLWVAVHKKDETSYSIWRDQQKLPEHKIYRLGDKDNFWQMGETGPCGYCSEIHYYSGEDKRPDPSQFMEIWNLVFMEFEDLPGGERKKLKTPCVDTGMGLERLCALLQNKKSNYHTDLFSGIIRELEKHCDFNYDFMEKQQTDQQKAFRVVADHSRAVSLLIADEVTPGNQKESYVLRRIIRRALYYSQKLQADTNFQLVAQTQPKTNLLSAAAKKTISLMEEANQDLGKSFSEYERHFDFLLQDKRQVLYYIRSEDDSFSSSLKEGEKRLEEAMRVSGSEADKPAGSLKEREKRLKIDKQTVWNLYSTYGFPMDLTRLIAKERGWTMPTEEEMEEYKNQLSQNFALGSASIQLKDNEEQIFQGIYYALTEKQKTTVWTAYKQDKEEATIIRTRFFPPQKALKVVSDFTFPRGGVSSGPIPKDSEAWLVLDKTCFYPEGGGPIGDKGWMETETGKALVLDCQKYEEMIAHKVRVLEGELRAGQTAKIKVNKDFRNQIAVSHTSTHLLNSALRSVLGDAVRQAGSLVEPGSLRFDFTFPRPLTKKELQQIEEQLYQSITREENVCSSHKNFDQAKEEGALYLKGEDYGRDEVRVIRIGDKTSIELCGGIHVQNTKEIKKFKIVSEKGVQSGVRRIVAYTGALAVEWEKLLTQQNRELRRHLDLPLPDEEKPTGKT